MSEANETPNETPTKPGRVMSPEEWPRRAGGAKGPDEATTSRYAPYFDGEMYEIKRTEFYKVFPHVHYLTNAFHAAADRLGVRIQVRTKKDEDVLCVRRIGGKIWDREKKDIVEPAGFARPLTTLPEPAAVEPAPPSAAPTESPVEPPT